MVYDDALRWCCIGLALGVLVAGAAGCVESGPTGAKATVDVEATYRPRPDSLLALAETARQASGLVVVGTPSGPPVDAAPERVLARDDIYLEYPRAEVDFVVTDALGAPNAPGMLRLCFPSAAARATDSAGTPRADVRVLPEIPPPQLWRQQPSNGEQVVFLEPLAPCMYVLWAADVVDGQANGRGTLLGEAESLDSLRL